MQIFAQPTYQIIDNDLLLDASEPQYVLRVKDLPGPERPREKMLASGPASLTQAELLAVLWGVGTRREDVLAMAKRTLHEYGEKLSLSNQQPTALAEALGIPLAKTCQLLAAFELGRRTYATGRSGMPVQVRTPAQAYEYFRGIAVSQKEQLHGLYLGSRHQVVHDEVISMGSLTSNVVHPREVFQPAIEYGAVAVILAHNHPSGSVDPSAADLETTRQLVAAGKILGIDLLDHLIVTKEEYKSIKEEL